MTFDHTTPADLLVFARTRPATRAAAYAELRRRLVALGPTCSSPVALAEAAGIPERTLRRILDDLDADAPVPVGWVRVQGGGSDAAKARAKTRAKPRRNKAV